LGPPTEVQAVTRSSSALKVSSMTISFLGSAVAGRRAAHPPPRWVWKQSAEAGREHGHQVASAKTRPPVPPKPTAVSSRCADCGVEIRPGRRRCGSCHRRANDQWLARAARIEADVRRAVGYPSSRPEVRERISASQREQWNQRRVAQPTSGFGIALNLQTAGLAPDSVGQLVTAAATGLSPGYCALVRRGDRIPASRHWAAFQLAGLQALE
jgi:hypothetical protein